MPKLAGSGGAGKRVPLNMRTTEAMRSKLENAAGAAGRSLAAEVEHRLEMSLAGQNLLIASWGEDFFQIASLMANSLSRIEQDYGTNWYDDERATEDFKGAAAGIIQNHKDHLKRAKTRWSGKIDLASASPEERASHYAGLAMLGPARRPIKANEGRS